MRIPIYTRDVTDHLTGATYQRLSFAPAEHYTHTYIAPLTGQDTGCIDYTETETELLGYVDTPAGAKLAPNAAGQALLFGLPQHGDYGLMPDDVIDLAKEGIYGLRWTAAPQSAAA